MAIRKKKHDGRVNPKRAVEHNGLYPYMARYLEWGKVTGSSKDTQRRRDSSLRRFIEWCDERAIHDPQTITRPILERYQQHLYYYRKRDGQPLSSGSQNVMLTPIRSFFKWLTRDNYIGSNPASELQLPKKPKRLPKNILLVDEVELILSMPDTATPEGLRDRAILETLYATGMRRMELQKLSVHSIDTQRGTVLIEGGKGDKDRYIPIGERAMKWVARYQQKARPQLAISPDDGTLFLSDWGEAFRRASLSQRVKRYIEQAEINKPGSCHLFRHAMATHMLENGADIRFIQAMLGHADLSTTQIYTLVSIEKLKEIHTATHPAKLEDRDQLLATLEAETEQDD